MKTIRLLLTMIILLAGFTGCVKDRGDYDYTDIPVFSTDDWQVKVNDKVSYYVTIRGIRKNDDESEEINKF